MKSDKALIRKVGADGPRLLENDVRPVTHGRSGLDRLLLGSTADRVLPSAPCPVLTVHQAGPK